MALTLDDVRGRYPDAQSYRPGDVVGLNTLVVALMRSGRKTATCEALSVFEAGLEAMPVVGRVDIVLNWDGSPALAARTCALDHIRFCDMTEEFVTVQAEFRDLNDWRAGYEAYLKRVGHFDPEGMMVVEQFEIVEDFEA